MKNSLKLGSLAKAVSTSKPVEFVKKNPVTCGVTATYVTGTTVAYVAAGVTVKTALIYTLATTAAGIALIYGANHLINKLDK